jgi:predicted transcriptional regulator of viral defense system
VGFGVKKQRADRVLELARKMGIVRPRDLKALGIAQGYLWRIHRRGLLERVGRGLYAAKDGSATENHSLVEAAKRVPHAVVCLISALSFHELTTQIPHEVWLAIGPKARGPKPNGLSLHIVRFSGKAMTSGIEEHRIEGVTVQIYNPAKTVADCFKYRNKIGLDVAIEALRDCRRRRRATVDDLWRYAKVCRVANVMRPYLEVLA